ncbi:MAG: hypothetical protein ACRD82_12460 [Blastocatellia bacterium]
MNILDENIISWQSQLLRDMKIRYRQIGVGFGRKGMNDRHQIIPLLHSLRRPTFFTRDVDFFKTDLLHAGHCLVFLDIPAGETAEYIRRFLRHSAFRTQAQRMGKVVRVRPTGLSWWEIDDKSEHALSW